MRIFTVLYKAGKGNVMGIPVDDIAIREFKAISYADALNQFETSIHKNDKAIAIVYGSAYNILLITQPR